MHVISRIGRNGKNVHKRNILNKVFLGIVKHLSYGRKILTHNPLHTIEGTQHMGRVDHRGTAAADENILSVIGHTHHLVGNDLTDGKNKVIILRLCAGILQKIAYRLSCGRGKCQEKTINFFKT